MLNKKSRTWGKLAEPEPGEPAELTNARRALQFAWVIWSMRRQGERLPGWLPPRGKKASSEAETLTGGFIHDLPERWKSHFKSGNLTPETKLIREHFKYLEKNLKEPVKLHSKREEFQRLGAWLAQRLLDADYKSIERLAAHLKQSARIIEGKVPPHGTGDTDETKKLGVVLNALKGLIERGETQMPSHEIVFDAVNEALKQECDQKQDMTRSNLYRYLRRHSLAAFAPKRH